MGIYNSNIDFNKYKYFYAVANEHSFSKASEALHVSQPAISYSVKELEEQLGTKLFVREPKKVSLTDDGQKLFVYVKEAFNSIITGENAINDKEKKLTGNIRLGIYSHIALFMLPEVISEFNKKFPYASFDIFCSSTDELKSKLLNNELDFIIVQYPAFLKIGNYTEEIICELENCFFSNKNYYDMYINDKNILEEYPLLLPKRGYEDIDSLEKLFKRKNMIIKNNFTIYTTSLMKELVKKGMGIGWCLRKCIEKELENKEFYEIPVNLDLPKTTFSISYNSKMLNKTANTFLDYFKNYIKRNYN